MKPPRADPRRADVAQLAAAGSRIDGQATAAELPRLTADAPLAGAGAVEWSAAGEQRSEPGQPAQTWLHLQARASVTLACQRCLQPLVEPLVVDRWIRFVADEAEAERLDEAGDDDVLALPPRGRVDLVELLEDELILALPLVPRHGHCPLPAAAGERLDPGSDPTGAGPEAATQRPFAVLAGWRPQAAAGTPEGRPAAPEPDAED